MVSLMMFVVLCVRYVAGISYNPWWLAVTLAVDLIILWFIILTILGLFTAFLVKWEPDSVGSGIPQINAEVKGFLRGLPQSGSALMNPIYVKEAVESSEIENIITTHDELFQSDVINQIFASIQSKEVYNYAFALESGFDAIRKNALLTNNLILKIQQNIEENRA